MRSIYKVFTALPLLVCVSSSCIQSTGSSRTLDTPKTPITARTTKAIGEQKVIVLLADFPDVTNNASRVAIHDRIFTELNDYLREMSYNQVWLRGNMTIWYTLPNPVSDYRISRRNKEVERPRVRSLVKDSLNAADNDVDFSKYDHVIIVLGASPQKYGMTCYCAIPGFLGNDMEFLFPSTKSGKDR